MSQPSYDPAEVLETLLKYGADIHGAELDYPVYRARHITIFAAVESMATDGTKWVDWCLKHGADINHNVFLFDQLNYHGGSSLSTSKGYYTATPALAYLQSLHRKTFEEDSKLGEDALKGIVHLVSHGAIIDPPPSHSQRRLDLSHRHIASPWLIELLIWKWGLAKAEKSPVFRAMLRYLIQHSASHGHAGEVLARCETAYTRWVGAYNQDHNDLLRESRKWTSEGRKPEEVTHNMRVHLLEYLLGELKVAPTTLLHQYIVARGRLMDQEEEITYVVIEHLLAEGADINAPIADDGWPALHRLCQAYHEIIKTKLSQWSVTYRSQRRFLRFLVEKSADGLIVIGGQTAGDILFGDITEYRYQLPEMPLIVGWKEKETIGGVFSTFLLPDLSTYSSNISGGKFSVRDTNLQPVFEVVINGPGNLFETNFWIIKFARP